MDIVAGARDGESFLLRAVPPEINQKADDLKSREKMSSSSSFGDDGDDDDDEKKTTTKKTTSRLPPPSPPVAAMPADDDGTSTSPVQMLSVKERIRMMQEATEKKKPSSIGGGGRDTSKPSTLKSKVGAMETTPRQLTPSFEGANSEDAKKKRMTTKFVAPLPTYTPYREETREENEEKKGEFHATSTLTRQPSAPVRAETQNLLLHDPISSQKSPRSPAFKERTWMFEQPVSVSQQQTLMLKNLRLKIQSNIDNSEEITLRKKKMNDAVVNLRKVKSKLEQKHAHESGTMTATTTRFRKRIISKLVETEFEIETKTMLFNGWKMQTEKEKEKRKVVNAKLDAIRVVALRRKFDHWRDVYASLQPRREALEVLESNAKQRNVRDMFNRWRKFAKLSHRAMHAAAMKTIDAEKKTLCIAFARWELALAKSAKSKAENKLVQAFVLKKTFIAWRIARDESAHKVEVARRKLRGDDDSEVVAFVDAWRVKTESERMSLYFRSEGSAARRKMERWKGRYNAAKNYVTTLLPLATLNAPWDAFNLVTPTNADEEDDTRTSNDVKKHVEESKVDALLREAKEAIQRADELREECEFARNVAEDAENASDFLLVMFQQGKDVSQTHLSNALLHAEKMYGKFTLLSAECEKASAEAVKRVRMAKEAERMAEKYEQIRLKSSYELVTTKGELCKDQPQKKTSSREIAVVFSNRNVAKRFLEKWKNAVEVLQRDRLELFFAQWREQTRKGLLIRADREIQIEKIILKRQETMKAKVFSVLYWHMKWREDRVKVLRNSVKPIANDSLYFALKRWKSKVQNKKLLFRVFTNCVRAWDEKRDEPYDMKNIQTKRDVLRVWLKNAKESKKLRDDYAKATQFHQLSLKLNALHAWNLKTRHSKQRERESFRERQINEQIADTFRRVSLKQKALRAWRVRVFNSWRERLATEMGYRNVARRVLRGWHRRVVY